MSPFDHKPLCPACNAELSRVVDSRGSWRRRECLNPECGMRFSTDERVRPVWETRQPKHRIPHVRRQPSLI